MARRILAIVVGFVVTGLLIVPTTKLVMWALPAAFDTSGGTHDTAILLLMHAYVALFATFGCWLAARLAPDHPLRHAMIVGVLGVLLNASNPDIWTMYPLWSNVISLATPLLWGWIGGKIREGQLAEMRGSTMATA